MCGIVGFMARDAGLRDSLGEFVVPMLTCMGERGPDSAGLAVFSNTLDDDVRRYSFYAGDREFDWNAFVAEFAAETEVAAEFDAIESHAILFTQADPSLVHDWLASRDWPV